MPLLKNAKHEAVVQAYIADPEKRGGRAYKSVYRKSSKHAAETGWTRLLKIVEVCGRIDELMGLAASDAVASATEVLERLTALARGNLQDSVHLTVSDSIIADVQALPREVAAALGELTVETYTEGRGDDAREVKRVKLKIVDRRGPLELLGKNHKLFVERVDPARADKDFVPLAERIKEYAREDAIAASGGKVVELKKRARKR